MKKTAVTLLTVLTLAFGGAFAQTIDAPTPLPPGQYWIGISSGGMPSGLSFHFGVIDALDTGLSLRANFATIGGTFGVGADAIANLPVALDSPLAVYAGGGPFVGLGGGPIGFGINLFVGAEYRLIDLGLPSGGLFAEIGPNLNILPTFVGGFYSRVGFNLHF